MWKLRDIHNVFKNWIHRKQEDFNDVDPMETDEKDRTKQNIYSIVLWKEIHRKNEVW